MPIRRSEIAHQTDGKGLPELNVEGSMDQWQVTKEEPWVDGQGRKRVTKTFEPKPGEPSREAIPCHTCGKPATCFGSYEDNFGAGCDECCGHGNEDGWCKPIAEIAIDFSALRSELQAAREHPTCPWCENRGYPSGHVPCPFHNGPESGYDWGGNKDAAFERERAILLQQQLQAAQAEIKKLKGEKENAKS